MIAAVQGDRGLTVHARAREERRLWRRVYVPAVLLTLVCGAIASSTAPRPLVVTLIVYLVAGGWILLRPVVGVYFVTFFTLLGDSVVTPWYPFVKNFSSRESISFVHDALVITPIELMLTMSVLGWLLGSYAAHSWRIRRGGLLAPIALFAVVLIASLGRAVVGVGDLRIAIFEGRALLYLPVLYFLIVQLFDDESQYRRLFLTSLVALLGQSLFAISYYQGLGDERQRALEALTEHSASVHIAAVLILLVAVHTIRGCSRGLRLLTIIVAVPGVLVFAYSERRSAAVGLGVGLVLLLILLFKVNRRALLFLLPLLAITIAGYLSAFWNNEGPWGLGAQAVKSVFAADQLGNANSSSSFYRQVESFDIWFTVRTQPLTGVGFGNPFYQPWPLPYLEGFEFRNYIPHNTILWIWLKLGVVGFVTTMFLLGRAIQHGARSVVRLASGDSAAIVASAVAYVAMYTVYAYVDIGWDARSTVFLAVAMALSVDYVGMAIRDAVDHPDLADGVGSASYDDRRAQVALTRSL